MNDLEVFSFEISNMVVTLPFNPQGFDIWQKELASKKCYNVVLVINLFGKETFKQHRKNLSYSLSQSTESLNVTFEYWINNPRNFCQVIECKRSILAKYFGMMGQMQSSSWGLKIRNPICWIQKRIPKRDSRIPTRTTFRTNFGKKAEQFVWRKSNISYRTTPFVWGLPIFSFRGMYLPMRSMYGIFSYIYLKNQPTVGQYTIHGSYIGLVLPSLFWLPLKLPLLKPKSIPPAPKRTKVWSERSNHSGVSETLHKAAAVSNSSVARGRRFVGCLAW